MEVRIIEESKNKIVLDLEGETPTIAGLINDELWNNEHVKSTGYNVAHPLINVPRIVLETDGTEPRKVLQATIKKVQKNLEKIQDNAKELK